MKVDIQKAFDDVDVPARDTLLVARDLIFDCAGDIEVTECLKWGQPSYLAPKGSTLRLGVKKAGQAAIYAHCQSTVVSDFAAQFGTDFEIGGNRAVLLGEFTQEDQDKLRALIRHGLTYKVRSWISAFPSGHQRRFGSFPLSMTHHL